MTAAVRVAAKNETGDEERFTCDCEHVFTRSQLDTRFTVEEFAYNGTQESLEEMTAWEVLGHHVEVRNECPHCSCCSMEEDEIHVAEDEDQWMCSTCLAIHDEEEDADECCEGE